MATSGHDQVARIAAEAIAPLGLIVDETSITPAGRRRVVRIGVDDDLAGLAPGDDRSAVPPVDLDRVADATRAISDALDAADAFGEEPYVLEVGSPGVSRPLTTARHYRRNVGRLVALTLAEGISPGELEGRLVAADGERLVLAVPGAKGAPPHEEVVPLADVRRGQVRIEFTHADGADSAALDADDSDSEEED